jgi:hypothetical protein
MKISKTLISGGKSCISSLPESFITHDMCLDSVRTNGALLEYIPAKMHTLELYTAAIENDGNALKYVPEHLRTRTMCTLAVQNNGNALAYVPTASYVPEIGLTAVQKCGAAITYLPRSERTIEICYHAVYQHGNNLKYVPNNLITYELCMVAVSNYGCALEHVPSVYVSEHLCIAAINNDWRAMLIVLENQQIAHLLSPIMCTAALRSGMSTNQMIAAYDNVEHLIDRLDMLQYDKDGLSRISTDNMNFGLVMTAVQYFGSALKYARLDHINQEMCDAAVANDGNAIYYVPVRYRTSNLCAIAVDKGCPLDAVPYDLRTSDLCLRAIRKNPSAIYAVPSNIMNVMFCMSAAIYVALKDIPLELRTLEVCKIAVYYNRDALPYVPMALRTGELCMIAIQNQSTELRTELFRTEPRTELFRTELSRVELSDSILQYVPMALRTVELCMSALTVTGSSILYVPYEVLVPEMFILAAKTYDGVINHFLQRLDSHTILRLGLNIARYEVPSEVPDRSLAVAAHNTLNEMNDLINLNNPQPHIGMAYPIIDEKRICAIAFRENSEAWFYIPESWSDEIRSLVDSGTQESALETLELEISRNITLARITIASTHVASLHVTEELQLSDPNDEFLAIVNSVRDHVDVSLEQMKHYQNQFIAALQLNGMELKYVPSYMITPDICQAAVQQNPRALKYVPAEMQTMKLCMSAVERDGTALEFVAESFQNSSIVMMAIRNDGNVLEFVPEKFKNPIMSRMAVEYDGINLKYVPEHMRTLYLCSVAVNNNGDAIEYVAPNMRTVKMYLEAVVMNGLNLRFFYKTFVEYYRRGLPHMGILRYVRSNENGNRGDRGVQNNGNVQNNDSFDSDVDYYGDSHQQSISFNGTNLVKIIENMRDTLGEHYDDILIWTKRSSAVAQHYDTQILALVLQTLSEEDFLEIALPEILGDNECCGDRTLMSINKLYTTWRFYSLSRDSTIDVKSKLEILVAGAKTIALRLAVVEGLKYIETAESVEIFLYAETKLQHKLKLLTIATDMIYAHIGNRMSLDILENMVNTTYLKIAAEHPLVTSLLDSETLVNIEKLKAYLNRHFVEPVDDLADAATAGRRIIMLKHCGALVESAVLKIKMKWIQQNIESP